MTLETDNDGLIELEIEAARKKSRNKFEIELSWKSASLWTEEIDVFSISSVAPEITEPPPINAAEEG